MYILTQSRIYKFYQFSLEFSICSEIEDQFYLNKLVIQSDIVDKDNA